MAGPGSACSHFFNNRTTAHGPASIELSSVMAAWCLCWPTIRVAHQCACDSANDSISPFHCSNHNLGSMDRSWKKILVHFLTRHHTLVASWPADDNCSDCCGDRERGLFSLGLMTAFVQGFRTPECRDYPGARAASVCDASHRAGRWAQTDPAEPPVDVQVSPLGSCQRQFLKKG